MKNNVEIRAINDVVLDEKENIIKGTAILIDSWSYDLGGFKEIIRKSALENLHIEDGNLFALHNHDYNQPLGSTKAGNLKITIDDRGLHFELKLNNTSYAKDVYENVKTGVVGGCSFGFYTDNTCKSVIGYDEDGLALVEINKILGITEITICASPAYGATSVEARNKIGYDEDKEKMLLMLDLLEL